MWEAKAFDWQNDMWEVKVFVLQNEDGKITS